MLRGSHPSECDRVASLRIVNSPFSPITAFPNGMLSVALTPGRPVTSGGAEARDFYFYSHLAYWKLENASCSLNTLHRADRTPIVHLAVNKDL